MCKGCKPMKLTVKQYATRLNISVQAVYQRIKKGTLKYTTINDVKYIVLEPSDVKDSIKHVDQDTISRLLKLLESKDAEIVKLTRKLVKCSKSKEKVLLQYISELKSTTMYLSKSTHKDNDIVDVTPTPKKAVKTPKKPKHKKHNK